MGRQEAEEVEKIIKKQRGLQNRAQKSLEPLLTGEDWQFLSSQNWKKKRGRGEPKPTDICLFYNGWLLHVFFPWYFISVQ